MLLPAALITAEDFVFIDAGTTTLELVRASDVLVEYDKLIDRQLERAAITSISGFAKIFQDAAKVLKLGG